MKDRGWILFGFLLSLVTAAPQTGVTLEEETVDVGEILHDLFIYTREARDLDEAIEGADVADVTEDVEEDAAVDDAVVDDAEAKTDEEAVAVSEAVDIERFNNYIDAIYRRMNAALRAKMMDPMQINLDQKLPTKKKEDDKEMPRVKREADEYLEDDVDELMEDEDVEIDHRMGKGKGNQKGKKEKKETGVKKGKGNKAKKGKKKEEREAAKKAKQEKKAKKQKDREEKRKNKQSKKKGDRESRSGDKKKKKRGNRKNKKSEHKNDAKKKQKNNKGNKKNSKKNTKSRSNHAAKSRQSNEQDKMLGSLSGIATLRRDGDVTVTVEDNHKVIKSSFNVGPLQLEVSKVSGRGKARTIRSAKAVTDVMKGTMTIKVKPDGSAHVKKVVFQEPENVDVKGSLNDNKTRNLRNMRRTVSKMRPLAALRVLKTARYVLKSPSSY